MNTQLTEIAFILDRSGSMESLTQSAITGFNQFLKEQQNTPFQARFSLILFSTKYELVTDALPVHEVCELSTKTYVPNGGTALLDAIGQTIESIGERLEATPEERRPGKVVIAILTDGEENSSRKFSHQAIAEMIAHQREQYQWEFLFLGANQDAIATAAKLNIAQSDAATFIAEDDGLLRSTIAISKKLRAFRLFAADPAKFESEAATLKESMQSMVDDDEEPEKKP